MGLIRLAVNMGIRRLMAINLMKRMESSVYSFNLTLCRIKELIDTTIDSIDDFEASVGAKIEPHAILRMPMNTIWTIRTAMILRFSVKRCRLTSPIWIGFRGGLNW